MIYGNGGRPFGRCDDFDPLRSSIGVGPQGDGIDVKVVEDDPYGYYRLQFLNSNTGEVLTTTPNLDPGSRFFVCTQDFTASTPYSTVFEANSTNFSTIQMITIQDARVGDLVIYHVFRAWPDDDNRYHKFLGFGAITSISNNGDEITFIKLSEFDTTMYAINIDVSMLPITNDEIDAIVI